MTHSSRAARHPVEPALEWGAASALAGAAAYALWMLVPAGVGPVGAPLLALAGGGVLLAAGLRTMRAVEGQGDDFRLPRFALPSWPSGSGAADELAELLLDCPIGGEDELLLDDPLDPADGGSRVVRLFEARPVAVPTAGQLAARIDRHLSGGAPGGEVVALPAPPASPPADDGAALRAALADLRASLQRG